jgi:hypothetical protein
MATIAHVRRWTYSCAPIDWWFGWWTLADALHHTLMASEHAHWHEITPEALTEDASRARWLATCAGWEGDGTWYVSVLPDPDACLSRFLFAVKQSNNGTTFIVSPFRLPWLHGDAGWYEEDRTDLPVGAERLRRKLKTLGDWVDEFGLHDAWATYISQLPDDDGEVPHATP